jgi:hypothetical protein
MPLHDLPDVSAMSRVVDILGALLAWSLFIAAVCFSLWDAVDQERETGMRPKRRKRRD